MDSTNKELIISEISAISENEVCVKLVDNLSDKPKKESCFEIKPDGENKQS
jgi:hypothetical protein